jgi:hypothetical protein
MATVACCARSVYGLQLAVLRNTPVPPRCDSNGSLLRAQRALTACIAVTSVVRTLSVTSRFYLLGPQYTESIDVFYIKTTVYLKNSKKGVDSLEFSFLMCNVHCSLRLHRLRIYWVLRVSINETDKRKTFTMANKNLEFSHPFEHTGMTWIGLTTLSIPIL